MATVSETELEQKTSEYVGYVREHFASTGKALYVGEQIRVQIDKDYLILEYEGK